MAVTIHDIVSQKTPHFITDSNLISSIDFDVLMFVRKIGDTLIARKRHGSLLTFWRFTNCIIIIIIIKFPRQYFMTCLILQSPCGIGNKLLRMSLQC